jgi:putative membrane protein
VLLINWVLLAVAFAVTAWLLSGMVVSGGFWGYVIVSAIFGLVNAIIGTILRILTIPLILVTLGLFLVIINAAMLELTDWLSSHLTIDEFFWTAIWAAIILSLTSVILHLTVGQLLRKQPAVA